MSKEKEHLNIGLKQNESDPELMNLLCVYLPTKHPYATTKWYCDVFDLDPTILEKGSPDGFKGGNPYSTYAMYFLLSQDELKLHFNANGSIHSSVMLKVTDIEKIYSKMMNTGTEILSDGIIKTEIGDMLCFKDIDGRVLEIVEHQPDIRIPGPLTVVPKLFNLHRLSFPTKDPYFTYNWYCQVFNYTPKMDETDSDLFVLDNPDYGYSIHFLRLEDQLQHTFHNREGYNHTYILLHVTNIQKIYENMKALGVEILNDSSIKDRGGCGSEIRFVDPDGRVIEINDYRT